MPTSKARPEHRDDDTIWLQERIAGITYEQGLGTESDEIPRGIPASEVSHNLRADVTAQGPATEIVLQMPATTRQWWLRAMALHPTSGTATTYKPRLGQAAGFAADGPDERRALDVRDIARPVNDVYCSPIPMRTDVDFKLYLRLGFDIGVANELTYQLWFDQRFETAEST